MHISEREAELPDAVIGKLIKMTTEDPRIVSLGHGEPDFDLPKPLQSYAKRIAGKYNHYASPGGVRELREAIAKKLKKDNKVEASPENIVVTCGSQEALLLAVACTADVSEQIIIPNPSFLAYLPTIELFNAFPVFLELKESEKWQINPDRLEKLIDKKKTVAILINTPSNPTGTVLDKKILEEIADIAIENDLYIFSDEAYEKIIYEKKHFSIGRLNGMDEHVATFQTFSKSYAMAGYRLGYVAAPPKLAQAIVKTHIYSTICAPTFSQMLGIKALSLQKMYITKMVNEYRKRRDYIYKRLNEIGLHTAKPEGAFYTFSNIGNKNSQRFAKKLLAKAHVATIPGSEFGSYGDGYIRCSYATRLEKISIAMDRMEKYLKH
mgnify:FL=1